jgi:hypothetical protein
MRISVVRAILYARFSPRPGANECESCDAQLELGRKYCWKKGWTVVGAMKRASELLLDFPDCGVGEGRRDCTDSSALQSLGSPCKLASCRSMHSGQMPCVNRTLENRATKR